MAKVEGRMKPFLIHDDSERSDRVPLSQHYTLHENGAHSISRVVVGASSSSFDSVTERFRCIIGEPLKQTETESFFSLKDTEFVVQKDASDESLHIVSVTIKCERGGEQYEVSLG